MIEDALLWLSAAGVAAFLIASATAPLATLSWWAGGGEDEDDLEEPPADSAPAADAVRATHYIVYLAGIHTIDGASHTLRERRFLDALAEAAGEAVLVDTVFPYAVSGEPLVHSPRLFSQLWRALATAPQAARRPLLANLINARNLFQVLVSADRRYGPIFNTAVAEHILGKLREAGWATGRRARVTLFGYSGGAQIAAGAAERLSRSVDGPIDLISLGGVIASPDGLSRLAHIRHLIGRRGLSRTLADRRRIAVEHGRHVGPARESRSRRHDAHGRGRLSRRDMRRRGVPTELGSHTRRHTRSRVRAVSPHAAPRRCPPSPFEIPRRTRVAARP